MLRPFVNRGVDAVAELICLGVCEGPRRVPENDADETVLLTRPEAQPLDCLRWQLVAPCLGQDRDGLDALDAVGQRGPHPVSELFGVDVVTDGDREVADG